MKNSKRDWVRSICMAIVGLVSLGVLAISSGWFNTVMVSLYWGVYVVCAMLSCLLYFLRWRMVSDSILKLALRDVRKRPEPMMEYQIFDHIIAAITVAALYSMGYQWLAVIGVFNWFMLDYVSRFHNQKVFSTK